MSSEEDTIKKNMNTVPFQNRYYVQIIVFCQVLLVIILLGTLMLPFFFEVLEIESDPSLIYFPYLAYIPNTITIVFILQVMKKFYLIQIGKLSPEMNGNYMDKLISSFQTEDEISGLSNILRRISILLAFIVTAFMWLLGFGTIPFGEGGLLLSPMNMLTLPFSLSGIMIYIVYGIQKEKNKVIGWLLIVFLVNIIVHIVAIALADDYLVLPLSLSYQISAFLLVLARFLYFNYSTK
jgi:hypothetical protein